MVTVHTNPNTRMPPSFRRWVVMVAGRGVPHTLLVLLLSSPEQAHSGRRTQPDAPDALQPGRAPHTLYLLRTAEPLLTGSAVLRFNRMAMSKPNDPLVLSP